MDTDDGGRIARSAIPVEADRLFTLPLAEFVAARNALAAQLKRDRRLAEAEQVKSLVKPSISVWAVNQIYWKHREDFDRLIDVGRNLREAQLAQFRGGGSNDQGGARQAMVDRRETVANLLRLSDALLRDAGHSPSQETLRRIGVTLEALSAVTEAPAYGRLTEDLDPPGFDLLAAWMPDASAAPVPAVAPKPLVSSSRARSEPDARIAQLRSELIEAERVLGAARNASTDAEEGMRRSASDAMQAEARRDQAREAFEMANIASEEATGRARKLAEEADEAGRAVESAEKIVERISRALRKIES